jgi:hypothetical protein
MYVALRAGMYESLQGAFAEASIDWEACFIQDVGDSILALAPSSVPKGAFAGTLVGALVTALQKHNEAHPVEEEQIKLRLALHAGEATMDEYGGVAAPAVIHACRLLNAQRLKDELKNSAGNLAMIVSDWFYDDVIRHHAEYAPDEYRKIDVDVKETNTFGWIRLPDGELSPEAPVAAGEAPVVVRGAGPQVVAPMLRPASPVFYEVVDALENIPCMQGEHSRSMVVDQLRFAGMVRYFASRRAHITSILRTCLDFEDGVRDLVTVISEQEGDSIPLTRLLKLLTGGGL